MSPTFTRTEWAMAQQVKVTGDVTIPTGDHEIVTVISGGPASTTVVTASTGPATPSLDVEHFAIREASAVATNVSVTVRTTPGKVSVAEWRDQGAATAQPAAGNALIGVNLSPHLHNSVTTLNALPTVDVVRFGIAWNAAQPSSSAWDAGQLALYDAVFADLHSRGIKAIVTCGTTPPWARSGGTILSPPTDPANHGAFVDSIVDRWGNDILCVDPWNEPNLDSFWTGTDAQYVALLAADRAAVDPAMPVSLSGGISLNDYAYIDALFAAGLTGAMFNWVDLHPYPISFGVNAAGRWCDPNAMPAHAELDGATIGGLHKIEERLAAHGVTGRNLIVSEVGVSTNAVDRTNPQLRLTDAQAASMLATCIDQLRRIPQMQAVCVFEGKDQVTGTGWANSFGCLDANSNRRARWATLNAAAN